MKISPIFALFAEALAQESTESNSLEELFDAAYDYVAR